MKAPMKLKVALPPDRTFEQVKNHYLIEKHIAGKLKKSNRSERKVIYETMYDELFSKVPDHPRLTRENSLDQTRESNKIKFAIVEGYLNESTTFLEFAPGDCKFSAKVAEKVAQVYAVDLSKQHHNGEEFPENFQLLYFDGYSLDEIKKNSVDITFSDQLIEHIHPEDTKLHFELALGILKTGGAYVFRMPHAQSGPHDVSRYFSDEPEGFHLKEWTYSETKNLLKSVGFTRFDYYWFAKSFRIKLPYLYFAISEFFVSLLPNSRFKKTLAKYLMPYVCITAFK